MSGIFRASNIMTSQPVQTFPAHEGATERKERLMDVRPPFVSDAQPAVLMQPRQRPFDDPPVYTQPAAVFGASLRKNGLDASTAKELPVRFGIIRSIPLHRVGLVAGVASASRDSRNRIDQRNQLSDIVTVRPGQSGGQRDAVGVADHVMFAPQFPSIRWIRPRLRPPKTARTDELSTTARDQSIESASESLARSTLWISCHTPFLCQSRRYRQHVIPEPQPISWGSISHGIPLRSTNRIPVNTFRRSKGLLPGYRRRRRLGGGRIGSISSHSSSETSSRLMCRPPVQRPAQYFVISAPQLESFC